MESSKILLLALDGVIAGIAGFTAYDRTGSAAAALLVTFTVAFVLHLFLTSKGRAWKSLSMLTEPLWTAILLFLLGFSYFSLNGYPMGESLPIAFGTGLLGGALGIFASYYWNIGS